MSDSSSASDSEEERQKKKLDKKKKKEEKKGKKRPADEEEATPEPEPKKTKSGETSGRPKDDKGNELFEFGNMRFASVSDFKGKKYLNIREYYIDKNSGKMAPGKKGISLTKAQWDNLKDIIPALDKNF